MTGRQPPAASRILCVPRAAVEGRLGAVPLGFTTDARLFAELNQLVRLAGEFRPRAVLEEDPTFLQIIVQGCVTRGAKILALFRAVRSPRGDRFVEIRHNAKIALCAGGHVHQGEATADRDLLVTALARELTEELLFEVPPSKTDLHPLGLVCRAAPGASLFDRVHLGVVFHLPVVGSVNLTPGSDEFTDLKFCAPEDLRTFFPRLEGWGQLLADALLSGTLRISSPATAHIRASS